MEFVLTQKTNCNDVIPIQTQTAAGMLQLVTFYLKCELLAFRTIT